MESKMSNECLILFGRELSDAEVELMRTQTGSKSVELRDWPPDYIANALKFFNDNRVPEKTFYYQATDYHSLLFLNMCDPVPFFICCDDDKTEDFLCRYLEFLGVCEDIYNSVDSLSYSVMVHRKQISAMGIAPYDRNLASYAKKTKEAAHKDGVSTVKAIIQYLRSIEIKPQ